MYTRIIMKDPRTGEDEIEDDGFDTEYANIRGYVDIPLGTGQRYQWRFIKIEANVTETGE